MVVKDLHMGIIDDANGIFDQFNFDAIVGMTYTYDSSVKSSSPTFMEEVMA